MNLERLIDLLWIFSFTIITRLHFPYDDAHTKVDATYFI